MIIQGHDIMGDGKKIKLLKQKYKRDMNFRKNVDRFIMYKSIFDKDHIFTAQEILNISKGRVNKV